MMSERSRILVAGSLFGALLGLVVAFLVAGSRDKRRAAGLETRSIVGFRSAGDWIKLVVSLVLLMRQLADLLAPAKNR